jgi:hypothetical protein
MSVQQPDVIIENEQELQDVLGNMQPNVLSDGVASTLDAVRGRSCYVGTAINGEPNEDGSVEVRVNTPWPLVKYEWQAYIILKLLSGRTIQDRDNLPGVLMAQSGRIGEDAAKIILNHAQEGELNFKDEELLEQCLERIEEDLALVQFARAYQRESVTFPCTGVTGPATPNNWQIWHDTASNKLYMNGPDGPSEITPNNSSAVDTVEKAETSGTIGET